MMVVGITQAIYYQNHKFIKLIIFKDNKGKGIAVKQGLQGINNEMIVIYDGDLEIHPNQIQNLNDS